MPRQQLELAPGELAAREARSQDDLPDDADGGLRANLVMVGDGLLGRGVGAQKGWGCWPHAEGGSQHAEQLYPLLWCVR